MSSVVESVLASLQGPALQRLATQVGADEGSVRTATEAALPLLLGALARNASSESGAQSLHGALQRDHDGGILNNLQGFLGGGAAVPGGAAILRHVLAARTGASASAVAKASGLNASQASTLLATLAPIVMAALGRAQRSGGLDAAALGRALGSEQKQLTAGNPAAAGLLTALLDRDGDGNVGANEVGAALLGFLRKK